VKELHFFQPGRTLAEAARIMRSCQGDIRQGLIRDRKSRGHMRQTGVFPFESACAHGPLFRRFGHLKRYVFFGGSSGALPIGYSSMLFALETGS
jgi:hypothetical protein